MSAVTVARSWLRRTAAAAPSAWHHDRVFRWSAIGAGVTLIIYVLGFVDPPAPRAPSAIPGTTVPANLGPAYGVPDASPSPSTTTLPKIDPGRPLDGVVIAPAPERERFGTVPPANHQ